MLSRMQHRRLPLAPSPSGKARVTIGPSGHWPSALSSQWLLIVQLWRTHSQNAIHYDTVAAERGLMQASVTATGTVNAVVDVQVGSQVSGNIKALYADFNTKVTKGQLVALIDPQVFQTQVDQAQAALGSDHSAVHYGRGAGGEGEGRSCRDDRE